MSHPHRLIFTARILTVLLVLFCSTLAGQAQEQISSPRHVGGKLWLVGSVTDRGSQPIAGLTIELWQSDESGYFPDPNQPGPGELREDFQYFGTATSDEKGDFIFRTQTPGTVSEQPAHLNLLVREGETTLLTTKWFFPEDGAIVASSRTETQYNAKNNVLLLLQDIAPECATTAHNEMPRIVFAQIVLDRGTGALYPTLPQDIGPFYPEAASGGSDNDLLDSQPDQEALTIDDVPEIALGRVGDDIWMIGTVYDRAGRQLEGYEIQLWQADDHGRHYHPDDDAPYELRDDFQYFGTAHTDGDGYLVFRTMKPYPYRQRPAHLHIVVKHAGETQLVTQFFFPEDHAYVLRDRLYLSRGHGDDELLFLHDLTNDCMTGGASDSLRVLQGRIVLQQGIGPHEPIPGLGLGPFPPVIDFSGYDNDLLDADPYQERLIISDIPQISELAVSESIEDVAPPEGGT